MQTVFLSALKTVAVAVLLLTVAIVALHEYVDLPTPYPAGSSPINPGQFGTSMFMELLKGYGLRVSYVSNWSYVRIPKLGEKVCVLLISPEYGYTQSEVENIARVLKSSGGILVVADETTTVNTILEFLGVQARVYGNRLLDEHQDFYPRATFYLENSEIVLRLDKASEIRNCGTVIGVAESHDYLTSAAELKPVACLEYVNNLVVLILGDGSLLTNQVLQLGGSYRELAKFLALEVRKWCGYDCVVLVEAGKYLSNRDLFLRLYSHNGESSFLVFLNSVVYSLTSVWNSFEKDPLESLREEAVATATLLITVTISYKLGRGRVELARTLRSFVWRGREDFRKVYDTIAEILVLLGCEPHPSPALVRCLENVGYEPRYSRALTRFMKFSELFLNQKAFSFLPMWRIMISRALKHSEKLLKVLEESLTSERHV
ncbi:MAG: DUF4350 domain-containing protein [Sulfolobales archaeon]